MSVAHSAAAFSAFSTPTVVRPLSTCPHGSTSASPSARRPRPVLVAAAPHITVQPVSQQHQNRRRCPPSSPDVIVSALISTKAPARPAAASTPILTAAQTAVLAAASARVRLRAEAAVAPPPLPVRTYPHLTRPVPDALPHEVLPKRRGRNAMRRVREAESFRVYMVLRRQLKPWSDQFRTIHGRTPDLADVHKAGVPGLLDRFVDYLEALQSLRGETETGCSAGQS
jgi:hypothetical protein